MARNDDKLQQELKSRLEQRNQVNKNVGSQSADKNTTQESGYGKIEQKIHNEAKDEKKTSSINKSDKNLIKKYAVSSTDFKNLYSDVKQIKTIEGKREKARENIDVVSQKPSIKKSFKKLKARSAVKKYDKKLKTASKSFEKDTIKMLEKFAKMANSSVIKDIAQKSSPEGFAQIIDTFSQFENFMQNEFPPKKFDSLIQEIQEFKKVLHEIQEDKQNLKQKIKDTKADKNQDRELKKDHIQVYENGFNETLEEKINGLNFGAFKANLVQVKEEAKEGGLFNEKPKKTGIYGSISAALSQGRASEYASAEHVQNMRPSGNAPNPAHLQKKPTRPAPQPPKDKESYEQRMKREQSQKGSSSLGK